MLFPAMFTIATEPFSSPVFTFAVPLSIVAEPVITPSVV